MVQNVRRGFNPRGDRKVFFHNLVMMYWTLNSIYMQFEYQHSKSSNLFVEHVQLLRGMFGLFEPREIVKLRFHNRFIYVGVDTSIYALLTGGWS